jgi:hypothetical protein
MLLPFTWLNIAKERVFITEKKGRSKDIQTQIVDHGRVEISGQLDSSHRQIFPPASQFAHYLFHPKVL